jgi:hypothetical protein
LGRCYFSGKGENLEGVKKTEDTIVSVSCGVRLAGQHLREAISEVAFCEGYRNAPEDAFPCLPAHNGRKLEKVLSKCYQLRFFTGKGKSREIAEKSKKRQED